MTVGAQMATLSIDYNAIQESYTIMTLRLPKALRPFTKHLEHPK
jgi:hypothetical protein